MEYNNPLIINDSVWANNSYATLIPLIRCLYNLTALQVFSTQQLKKTIQC